MLDPIRLFLLLLKNKDNWKLKKKWQKNPLACKTINILELGPFLWKVYFLFKGPEFCWKSINISVTLNKRTGHGHTVYNGMVCLSKNGQFNMRIRLVKFDELKVWMIVGESLKNVVDFTDNKYSRWLELLHCLIELNDNLVVRWIAQIFCQITELTVVAKTLGRRKEIVEFDFTGVFTCSELKWERIKCFHSRNIETFE